MKNTTYIGMAARMVPDKLHELLINLIFLNKSFFINNKIQILFAGDGLLLKSLKEKIEFMKLKKIIIFNGRLDEVDLIRWFKKLDIYIHLSKDETTSTSILQAMSIGKPIIASNIGGNKKLLKFKNNLNNIFLVNNDKNKIFKILKKFISRKNKFTKISKFSRQAAIKYFSHTQMFEKYEKLFSKNI